MTDKTDKTEIVEVTQQGEKGLLEFFGELFNLSGDQQNIENQERLATIYQDILAERQRQDDLKAQGKFSATCADELPAFEKLAILAEEFGEVAKELCECNNTGHALNSPHLRTELIQVAAVAIAWVEALDKEFNEQG